MSGSTIGGIVGGVVGAMVGYPQIGFMIGSMIGGYVDPEQVIGPRLQDATVQTSQVGIAIPFGWGAFPVAGNLLWAGDIIEHETTERQGKGGPEVTKFTYTRSYAIGLCQGMLREDRLYDPVAGVLLAKRNQKVVYDARTDAELIELGFDNAYITEVRAQSAKFLAKCTFYLGGEDQLPDPTMESYLGVGNVPAYPGLVYMALEDDDTEGTGAVAQYEVVISTAGTSYQTDPILADGPVLYWKLNEGGGPTAYDYSGNGYHGTYYGDVTYHGDGGVEWGPTSRNGGVERIGAEPVDLDVATDGVFSIETFATITAHASSADALLWKGLSLTGVSNWRLWVRNVDDPPDFTLEGTTTPAIGLDTGHHYCITGDGTTIRYYVDVAEVHTTPVAAIGAFDNAVRVGSPLHTDSYCWKGRQRNAAVFNKCLTPEQIALHAALGLGGVDGVPIPGAPGWYVNADGSIFTDSPSEVLDRSPTVLGTIVAGLHRRVGIPATSYDVSQLTDLVQGVKFASIGGPDSMLQPLMQASFFDKDEHDGKLHWVKRGGNVVADIGPDDFVARDGDVIEWTRVQEAELLRKSTITYLDPAANWAPTTQKAERRVSTVKAKGESLFQVPLCMSSDAAAQMVDKTVRVSWSEPDKCQFSLSLGWSELTATDIVNLTDKAGVAHRVRLLKIEEDSGVLLCEAVKDRQSSYTSNVEGKRPPASRPTLPGLGGPTQIAVMDLPVMRDADDALGVYIAVRGYLAGWTGAAVYLSTDGGASGGVVATLDQASVIGFLESSLVASHSAEYLSQQSIQVWLPRAPSSVSYDNLLRYNNRAAVQLDSGEWEVLQYQTVTDDGDGLYTLAGLVRGRYATTPGAVSAGATFVLLDASVAFLPCERWMIGEPDMMVKAVSFGTNPDETAYAAFEFTTPASQTEWPPYMVQAERDVSDNVTVTGYVRARLGTETAPHHSQYFAGVRIAYSDGETYDVVPDAVTGLFTHTRSSAPPAQTITAAALNTITGAGQISEEVTV